MRGRRRPPKAPGTPTALPVRRFSCWDRISVAQGFLIVAARGPSPDLPGGGLVLLHLLGRGRPDAVRVRIYTICRHRLAWGWARICLFLPAAGFCIPCSQCRACGTQPWCAWRSGPRVAGAPAGAVSGIAGQGSPCRRALSPVRPRLLGVSCSHYPPAFCGVLPGQRHGVQLTAKRVLRAPL